MPVYNPFKKVLSSSGRAHAHPRLVYAMGCYVASRNSDTEQLRATFDGFDLDGSGMLEAREPPCCYSACIRTLCI